jgi:hypothetical protein
MTWLVFRGPSTGKAPSMVFRAICLLEKVGSLDERNSSITTLWPVRLMRVEQP